MAATGHSRLMARPLSFLPALRLVYFVCSTVIIRESADAVNSSLSPIIVNPSTAEAQASCRRKYVREEVLEQHFICARGGSGAAFHCVARAAPLR